MLLRAIGALRPAVARCAMVQHRAVAAACRSTVCSMQQRGFGGLVSRRPCALLFSSPPPVRTPSAPLLACVLSRDAHFFPVPKSRRTKKYCMKRDNKKLKLKSHSGAKKRFKLRADGLFLHGWSGKRHLNVNTPRNTRLRKRGMKAVQSKGMNKILRKLLPYGGFEASSR